MTVDDSTARIARGRCEAVSAVRVGRIDDDRRTAVDVVEAVVVAHDACRRKRAVDAQEILLVELVLKLEAEAAGVRAQLVVGCQRAEEITESGVIRTVEEPVAVEREAVQTQVRRRTKVLRVLDLRDRRIVVRLIPRGGRYHVRARRRAGVDTVGEGVRPYATLDRVESRAVERLADVRLAAPAVGVQIRHGRGGAEG